MFKLLCLEFLYNYSRGDQVLSDQGVGLTKTLNPIPPPLPLKSIQKPENMSLYFVVDLFSY